MDEFVSSVKIAAEYLVGIFSDLINLAMEYPFMAVIIVSGIGFLVFDNLLMILSGHKGVKSKVSPMKVSKLASAGTFGLGKGSSGNTGSRKAKETTAVGTFHSSTGPIPFGYSSVVGGGKFTKSKPVKPKNNGHFASSSRRSKKSMKTDGGDSASDTSAEELSLEDKTRLLSDAYGDNIDWNAKPPPERRNHNIDIYAD